MANVAIEAIDSMIKEYLIFRGFTATLKSFELQIKNDKNKSFKVERILENFSNCIQTYDIVELKKYWNYFDKCFFSKLGHEAYKVIKKLESRVLRLYIVHALQSNKAEKVTEFFEKYVAELQHDENWREWFLIPYIKNPEQNKTFSIYFTKIWQDSVLVSLANCIDTICSHLTLPKLLDFEKENQKLKCLSEENTKLKEQIMELSKQLNQEKPRIYNSVCIQTNEKEMVEMEMEVAKTEKRNSSVKGRFAKIILGSKDKDLKATKKEASPTSRSDSLLKKHSKLISPVLPTETISYDTCYEDTREDDSIIGNMHKEKIQFQSDYYASAYLNDEDKGIINDVPNMETNNLLSSHDEGKSIVGLSDDQLDAPFIILNQNEFTEHSSPIVSCRFSENNRLVASLDLEGTFKVWECFPDVSQSSLFSTKADILCLDWIPKIEDKILVGKSNGHISVHDINSRKVLWESSIHQKYKRIARVNCSPMSTSAVCSAVIPMSETRRHTLPAKLSHPHKMIKMKQYSAHNETSGARQGIISEWDLHTGQLKSELCLDPYPVYIHSMAYNHNGTLLVTGGADGMVRLFDIRNSDCLIGWHAHSTDILDVVFNPDETSIYSIAADGKVCVWDVNKVSSKIGEFPLQAGCTGLHHYWVSGGMDVVMDDIPAGKLLACDSDGQHMMTCGPSGLMIYKIQPKTIMEESMHVICPSSEVLTLDWTSSPSRSTVLCGTKQGTVQISTLQRKT